jgi:regulator of cell morphogenesis and NO signaling
MNTISQDTTIAEIVTERPATAALFERFGIDFCCGGQRSLASASEAKGIDPQTVLDALDEFAASRAADAGAHEVSALSVDQLVDHIVKQHHDKLREQIPAIGELLERVVRVHGAGDATLAPLQEKFNELSSELATHIELEESTVFPACRAAAAGGEDALDPALLDQLTHEHEETGAGLVALRELSGDYDQAKAHCNTHRFLLQSLADFERDLHLHVHEENNVLFPQARQALAAAS